MASTNPFTLSYSSFLIYHQITPVKYVAACGAATLPTSMVFSGSCDIHVPILISAQVSFDATSQGQVAMVIYEWADAQFLGKVTSTTDDTLPVGEHFVE
jgi:hypothetical protein